jgi:glycosyltransferase involved in cell wall biosynthesis
LKLSLILPVYNPAPGWADIVLAKTGELASLYPYIDLEAIVVNDGSATPDFTDGKNKIQKSAVRLVEYTPNKGKGEAIRTGVRASTGEIVIYTDIDFPYTIESISGIIRILVSRKADVVVGIKDSSYYAHVPPVRRLVSRFLRMLIRLFIRIPTDDTQCGLKGFSQKAKPLFLQTTIKRYLFDLEFVFLASRADNINIKVLPVRLCEGVEFRKMNFGIIKNESGNFLKIFLKSIISK